VCNMVLDMLLRLIMAAPNKAVFYKVSFMLLCAQNLNE
jgi:hypothetical protein